MTQSQKDTLSIIFIVSLALVGLAVFVATPPRLGLDLQGGMFLVLQAEPSEGGRVTEDEIEQARFIVEERVNGLGVTEPQIERQVGTPNIIIQLPGIKNPQEALSLIRSTALLEFKEVVGDDGTETLGPTLMTGKAVQSARVGYDELGRAKVDFTLTPEGTKRFEEITKRLAPQKKQLAIVLDGRVVSAPAVQSVISGGRGEITGQFTTEEAKNLALVLNTGALPVKLAVAQQQTVGPTLGQDSLRQALRAGLAGLLLVAVFALVMYRALGLILITGLLVFSSVLMGSLTLIGATLTLPGIAGIILSIGVAADSGIVYFERFREEFVHGKEARSAARSGFGHALRTILDADATTVIIALTLVTLSYVYFGSGPVRGFAITLSFGVVADFFTAYFFKRPTLIKLSSLSIYKNPAFIGVRRLKP